MDETYRKKLKRDLFQTFNNTTDEPPADDSGETGYGQMGGGADEGQAAEDKSNGIDAATRRKLDEIKRRRQQMSGGK